MVETLEASQGINAIIQRYSAIATRHASFHNVYEYAMNNEILTQAELKDIVEYDKDTGIMTRNGKVIGGEITEHDRYMKTSIGYVRYKIHRLAWLYENGEWPKYQIDHINGDRSDNRVCNLRDISQSENNRNAAKRKDNVSGCTGVIKIIYKDSIYWQVRIGGGKRRAVGSFKTYTDAVIARKMAEYELDYDERHGT